MNFDDAMYEVLQRPKYDRLTGRSVDVSQSVGDWLTQLINWIFDQIDIAFPEGSGINTNAVATMFTVIGGIMAIVAGIILVRSFLRSRVPPQYDLHDIFEELAQHNYTVSELIELSQRSTDRRIAVRYRYIAALLALNERQTIRIEPSATNAVILRQIQSNAPQLTAAFTMVADVFHLSWFGYKDVRDDAFHEFTSAVNILVSAHKKEG